MPKDSSKLIPTQPYVSIQAEDYKRMITQRYGISHFYVFSKASGTEPINAVPDGSVDLVFGINDRDVKAYIGGTVLKAKMWPLEDGRTYFGVRFQPGQCVLPHDLSIQDIIDDDLEINADAYGNNMAELLESADTIEERADIFLKAYISCMSYSTVKEADRNIEAYIRNEIYKSRGKANIKELSQKSGYSECYIRKVFHNVHGISPKVFEKIVRFQNLLDIIAGDGAINLDELAVESGFYDQSHMIKDFRACCGLTPEAYHRMITEAKKNRK